MKILCRIFRHKYNKAWKNKSTKYFYNTTNCMRCGHYKWIDQKIYFSGVKDTDSGWVELQCKKKCHRKPCKVYSKTLKQL